MTPDYLITLPKEVIPKTRIGKMQDQKLSQKFEAEEFSIILKQ